MKADGTPLADSPRRDTIVPDPKTPRLKGHTDEVRRIAFLPDGKRAVSVGKDGRWLLWDLARGTLIRNIDPTNSIPLLGLGISSDGKLLAVGTAKGGPGIVSLYDLEKEIHLRWWPVGPGYVDTLTFTRDGQRLVVSAESGGGQGNGTFYVFEVATGKKLADHTVTKTDRVHVSAFAFVRDAKQLLVRLDDRDFGETRVSETAVLLWDLERSAAVRRFPLSGHKRPSLALFPDGERVAICQADGDIQIWPLIGKEPIRKWSAAADSLKLLHGGRWLLTVGADKRTVQIWDVATGKALHEAQADNPVSLFDVSPDGKLLLTAFGTKDDGDFDLRLWRLPVPD